MNINTLLINPQYIKQYSTVGDNVDDCYLVPAIIDSQLIGLQPIIGTMLYDSLCEMVDTNTMTAECKALVDNFITPYLLNKVQAYLLMNLYAKQRNAGVVTYLDTNQQNLDIASVKYIKAEFESKATFYANRMVDYLHANSKLFPEYQDRRDCADLPSDAKDAYSQQLNLHRYYNRNKKI